MGGFDVHAMLAPEGPDRAPGRPRVRVEPAPEMDEDDAPAERGEEADEVRNAPMPEDPARRLVPADEAAGAHGARLRDDQVDAPEQGMVGLLDPEHVARV